MTKKTISTLAALAVIVLLIKQSGLNVNAKSESNNGLVQLAQKDFGAFLQYATESAGKVRRQHT